MKPYFDDGQVVLYHGDCREVLPALTGPPPGVVVADPPYGETSLLWDRWPAGWIDAVAAAVRESCSMWCFGSMRMFLEHSADFNGWQLAQDVVWRKHNGSGFAVDRFKRVHENVLQWYRGSWADQRTEVPRLPRLGGSKGKVRRHGDYRGPHVGVIADQPYVDDGTRLMQTVIDVQSCQGRAIHPTQKPLGIIDPLLRYSLAPGGTVLDPFAGSCSTLVAAREAGYRAIGIEADEAMCEKAVTHRLAQGALALGGSA